MQSKESKKGKTIVPEIGQIAKYMKCRDMLMKDLPSEQHIPVENLTLH